jgi:hypothetical protein
MSVNYALSSAEKLARQREAAAIARSHAHMLQIKIVVVCGCAIVGALGFALHRGSAANSATPPEEEKAGIYQGAPSVRIGQIQVPYDGDTCLNYRFDNKTGVVGDEATVSCTPVNIVPTLSEASRTDAVMKAFRFNK